MLSRIHICRVRENSKSAKLSYTLYYHRICNGEREESAHCTVHNAICVFGFARSQTETSGEARKIASSFDGNIESECKLPKGMEDLQKAGANSFHIINNVVSMPVSFHPPATSRIPEKNTTFYANAKHRESIHCAVAPTGKKLAHTVRKKWTEHWATAKRNLNGRMAGTMCVECAKRGRSAYNVQFI